MARVKVLVADDHPLMRRGIVETLSGHADIELVGQASSGAEAVKKARELTPDVVVMDLQMANMGGLEATLQLQTEMPEVRILVLTVSEKQEDLFSAMRAGARGYLLKGAGSDEVIRAVLHIAEGGVLVSPAMAASVLAQFSEAGPSAETKDETGLGPREREVLKHVAEGASNKGIAASLLISENTVKTHLRNIMDKLHLANRSQVAAYATRHGLDRHSSTKPLSE